MRILAILLVLSFASVGCIDSLVNERGADSADDDDDIIVPPAQITGSYLAQIKNRCGFKRKSMTDYDLRCHLVKLDENGKEYKIEALVAHLKPQWANPVILTGEGVAFSCRGENNNITQICEVTTKNGQAKLEIAVKIEDIKLKQEKTEKEIVLLPYSIGVAAGLVPSIPNQFAQENPANKEVGFQPLKFQGKDATIYGDSVCAIGDKVYFDTFFSRLRRNGFSGTGDEAQEYARVIYEFHNGIVSNFIGAGFFASGSDDMLHRLNLKLSLSVGMTCTKDAIYITDSSKGRVLKIDQSGKVTEVFNTGEEKIILSKVAFDSKAKVYVLSNNAQRISSLYVLNALGKLERIELKVADSKTPGKLIEAQVKADDIEVFKDQVVLSESAKHIVWRVRDGGVIEPLAGTGTPGKSGDSAAASLAKLTKPKALSLNAKGELLIGEGHDAEVTALELKEYYGNRYGTENGKTFQVILAEKLAELDMSEKARIRKIHLNEKITTLRSVPRGHIRDFAEKNNGDFVVLTDHAQVSYLVSLLNVTGMVRLAGREGQFISDDKKLDARSTILGRPNSLAVNKKGEIFYLDTATYSLRKIGLDQTIHLIANYEVFGTGIVYPLSIALTPEDDVLVTVLSSGTADKHKVLRVTQAGVVSEIKARKNGQFQNWFEPSAVFVDKIGQIYVAEAGRIAKIDKNGDYSVLIDDLSRDFTITNLHVKNESEIYFTNLDGFYAIKNGKVVPRAQMHADLKNLNVPMGVTMDPENNVYIAGGYAGKIQLIKDAKVGEKPAVFFGKDTGGQSCGSGQVQSQAERDKLDDVIQMGLSHICAGHEIAAIASYDGCLEPASENRLYRMAFAQFFGDGFNIIQISRACE